MQPPSTEDLIEKSKNSSVKADAIWIEITTVGQDASRWVLDLNREGSCYLLRDAGGGLEIYGGGGFSKGLVTRAFSLLTKRSVIYASRGRPSGQGKNHQLVSIGMATWDGSRVYKTQSGTIEGYPQEVQKIIADLRKSAENLPLSRDAMGSIQSTFLRPAEARNMLKGGKRVVTVDDPGKDAKELSTLEMALRLPGRDIVVPTAGDWEALQTYVVASNPDNPDAGEFFVQNSKRTFRITMNQAAPRKPDDEGSNGQIPRAKPVGE